MKKTFLIVLVIFGLLGTASPLRAQSPADTLPVPFGGFEQWADHPGDTLTVMFFPLPLYGSYSLPQGWNIPLYDFSDTLSYMGMTLPISTALPMGIVGRDTLHQPEGSSAVVAQTFMLSDILPASTYALLQSFLDTSITNQVIPTLLSNAQVDVTRFLPLMEDILQNTGGLAWMLDMLDTVDINDYISGGFPLTGFEPRYLEGKYKFIDAGSNDHATIVAIGTYYDTLQHRRMLVGAGTKNLYQLFDTVDYEPFRLEYFTLSSYFPAQYSFVQPDTMIIALVSSASEKHRAQGSRLFVDDLRLIHADGSCGRIQDLAATEVGETWAQIRWNNTLMPDRWQAEWGREGFRQGTGNRLDDLTDSAYFLSSLDPGTTYGIYVRGFCGDTSSTSWVYTSFTTRTHEGIGQLDDNRITLQPNPAHGSCQVSLNGTTALRLRLYDPQGRLIEESAPHADKALLRLPAAGLYILEVVTPDGTIRRRIANQ